MSEPLNKPPFPHLEWDGSDWQANIVLPAWAGFQSRLGDYGAEDSTDVSDGSVDLGVRTENGESEDPSPEQAAAYRYLIEHQEVIRDKILDSVFQKYKEWRKKFGYDEGERKKYRSGITNPDQLRLLMELSMVRIFNTSKNGLAYIGFGFGVTRDDMNGLWVLTHASRVVDVGGSEPTIFGWLADEDAERPT